MSSMTASLLDSSYNQVAFTDIQEHYCHQKDLECRFSLSSTSTPNCNDVIGIFKVGWKSTKDFICNKTVEVPEGALSSSVVFTAAELPKDMHEFYQFCYICQADQRVHGISSPFQFVDDLSAIDWELVENEPQPAPSVLTQLSQPEPSIVVIENDSSSAVYDENEKVNSVVHYEVQIRDLNIKLLTVQQELASMNRDKEQSLNLQTTVNEMTSRYQDAETKCQEIQLMLQSKEKLAAASQDKSFNLLTTIDELKKCFIDLETKHKEAQLMLESREAELKHQEEQMSHLREQLAHEKQGAELRESTQKQHQAQIDEVTRQKSIADAEIVTLKNKLQQTEIEMKAASDVSQGKLLDLQEQLNAEKEKNNELDMQIKTWKDTQLATLGSSSTRLDSLILSDGANAAENTKTSQCPVCDMEFPKDDPVQVNEAHVLAHLERVCPVCDERFQPNVEERTLRRHVESCLVANHQTKRKF